MSKSKGNVAEPFSLVEKHGADAIRFWCSNTPLGTDSAYSEDRLDVGKKFITKLWNTLKFTIQNEILRQISPSQIHNNVDFWVLGELQKTIAEYVGYMEKMDYFHARKSIDSFFWNIFCDNYLEFIKIRYYGAKAFIYKEKTLSQEEITKIEASKNSAVQTVFFVMKGILSIYSPFCPFICEKVHSILFNSKSLHSQGFFANFQNEIGTINIPKTNGEEWLAVVDSFRKHKTENTTEEFFKHNNFNNLPQEIQQYMGIL